MNQQTIEWLKEVRWRADKATKGPWKKMGTSWISYDSGKMFCVLDDEGFTGTEQAHVNSAFIAHSRNDISRFLSLVDELQKELAEAKSDIQNMASDCDHCVKEDIPPKCGVHSQPGRQDHVVGSPACIAMDRMDDLQSEVRL